MDGLILKTDNGNAVTTSLIVARVFEKEHKNVLQSIRSIIYSAENSAQFYRTSSYVDSTGKTNEMIIMNRDGFSLLVMGFTGETALQFKIAFIEAFNKMESVIKNNLPDFNNPAVAARAWAEQYEARQMAEKEVKELQPKAMVFDKVMASNDCIDIGDAAKIMKLPIGRNRLFKVLRDKKILMLNNIPYQKYIDLKYFICIETPVTIGEETRIHVKTLATQKGIDWLVKIFN